MTKKQKLTRETARELIEKWIGIGKVNIIDFRQDPDSDPPTWTINFRCHGKAETVRFDNYHEADEFNIEFGGKNNLTVAAPHELLWLAGWDSATLYDMGHRIISIQTGVGHSESNIDRIVKYQLPEKCGTAYLPGSSKKDTKSHVLTIKEKIGNYDTIMPLTASFEEPMQIDEFKKYFEKNFPKNKIPISNFVSMNVDTSQLVKFERKKVGDGTQRMELRLVKLDGKEFSECRYKDIISAADGLAASECERVKISHNIEKHEDHCGIHLGI